MANTNKGQLTALCYCCFDTSPLATDDFKPTPRPLALTAELRRITSPNRPTRFPYISPALGLAKFSSELWAVSHAVACDCCAILFARRYYFMNDMTVSCCSSAVD